MSKIVLTMTGLRFHEELANEGMQSQNSPRYENVKQAPQPVKSRPRVLPKVQYNDVPVIRHQTKYPGYLGPPKTSQSQSRLSNASNMLSRGHSRDGSQSGSYKTPLFMDFETMNTLQADKQPQVDLTKGIGKLINLMREKVRPSLIGPSRSPLSLSEHFV